MMGWFFFIVALGALAWQNREKLGFSPQTETDHEVEFEDETPPRQLNFSTGIVVDTGKPLGIVVKVGHDPSTVRGDGSNIVDYFPIHIGNTSETSGHQTQAIGIDTIVIAFPEQLADALIKRLNRTRESSTNPELFTSALGVFLSAAYYFLQASGAATWGTAIRSAEGDLNWSRFMGKFVQSLVRQAWGEQLRWEDEKNNPLAPEIANIWKYVREVAGWMESNDELEHFFGRTLHDSIGALQALIGDQAGVVGLSSREADPHLGGHQTAVAAPRLVTQLTDPEAPTAPGPRTKGRLAIATALDEPSPVDKPTGPDVA